MAIYFSTSPLGFYDSDIHKLENIPKDSVVISKSEHRRLLDGQLSGMTIVGDIQGAPILIERQGNTESLRIEELRWIDSELIRIREELEKVQDSDQSATGTVSQWREYRKAVRAWSLHAEFPIAAYRPISPDSKGE